MQVGPQGEIIIPKRLQKKLGFQPGIEVDLLEEARSLRLVKKTKKTPIAKAYGLLGKPGKSDDLVKKIRGR